jgi:hypothetical protein
MNETIPEALVFRGWVIAEVSGYWRIVGRLINNIPRELAIRSENKRDLLHIVNQYCEREDGNE